VYLRDLVIAGKARPSFIVSHRLPLSRSAETWANFDYRGVGAGKEWTKVLLESPKLRNIGVLEALRATNASELRRVGYP
jgi:hypothetical protein